MAEYTYKDVIIDPEDPRVEIGKMYYFSGTASDCLAYARRDDYHYIAKLREVTKELCYPFEIGNSLYACLIRKKEPEYVPFDLSKEEDRDFLKGKWVKGNINGQDYHFMIIGFKAVAQGWCVDLGGWFTGEDLLEKWTFDDGTPCGKLVEQMASK